MLGLTARRADIHAQKAASYQLFDRISHRYDILNHLLSAGQDILWRKKAVRLLNPETDHLILDLATGTGDLLKAAFGPEPDGRIGVGVDLSEKMLRLGQRKLASRGKPVYWVRATGDQLPFSSGRFDAVMIAFGIRNIHRLEEALAEIHRVLRPGGLFIVLEFSLPHQPLLRAGYFWYFRLVLPVLGGLLSGDLYAYRYLNRTVEDFPYGEAFCRILRSAGFEEVTYRPLTFGIATLYAGKKNV